MNTESHNTDALVNLFEIISFRKIQVIVSFLIVFGIVFIGVIFLPPVYTATTTVYVGMPSVPKGNLPYISDIGGAGFISNQLTFARSRSVYEKAAREIRLPEIMAMEASYVSKFKSMVFKSSADPLEKAIDILYGNTSVGLKTRGTNILEIVATSSTADGAADFANAIANSYTDFANNLLQSKSNNAYDYIAEQLEASTRAVNDSQKRLFDFMKVNNVTSLDAIRDDRTNAQKELGDLKLKYKQRTAANAVNQERADDSADDQIRASDTIQVREAKGRLQKLKRDLKTMLAQYTDSHPQVMALASQIEKEKEDLARETGAVAPGEGGGEALDNNRQKRHASLLSKIKNSEKELSRLSQIEFDLTKLMREAGNRVTEHGQLQQQFESAVILKTNAIQEGRIRILEPAYPPTGANNKKRYILLLVGFVAALVFSVGTAFMAEYFNDSLNSSEEVENYLKISVLGSIPEITANKQNGGLVKSPNRSLKSLLAVFASKAKQSRL